MFFRVAFSLIRCCCWCCCCYSDMWEFAVNQPVAVAVVAAEKRVRQQLGLWSGREERNRLIDFKSVLMLFWSLPYAHVWVYACVCVCGCVCLACSSFLVFDVWTWLQVILIMMCLQHATMPHCMQTVNIFSGQMRRLIPDILCLPAACPSTASASWPIINLVSLKCLLHIHSWQMNGLRLLEGRVRKKREYSISA